MGPNPAEQRRAENQPGQQLPDHGRLAEALHDFAKSAPNEEQQGNLDEKHDFARATHAVARGTA